MAMDGVDGGITTSNSREREAVHLTYSASMVSVKGQAISQYSGNRVSQLFILMDAAMRIQI